MPARTRYAMARKPQPALFADVGYCGLFLGRTRRRIACRPRQARPGTRQHRASLVRGESPAKVPCGGKSFTVWPSLSHVVRRVGSGPRAQHAAARIVHQRRMACPNPTRIRRRIACRPRQARLGSHHPHDHVLLGFTRGTHTDRTVCRVQHDQRAGGVEADAGDVPGPIRACCSAPRTAAAAELQMSLEDCCT
jgi:hypothetical protein